MSSYDNLRRKAVDRHKAALFGREASIEILAISPQAGETIVGMFSDGWFGQRIEATTDGGSATAGAWQFQIGALPDWETSQAFMLKATSVKVKSRRWAVKKVEKPIGLSLMWKIRAEIQ